MEFNALTEIQCTNPKCFASGVPQAGAWRKKEDTWEANCLWCGAKDVESG